MGKAFLEIIRGEISPLDWSKGVSLVREGAVTYSGTKDGAAIFHLRMSSKAFTPEVSLWPEDEDFFCNCGSEKICAHIAAAAIYWGQNEVKINNGCAAATAQIQPSKMRYNLIEKGDSLELTRCFLLNEQSIGVTGSLVRWMETSPYKSRVFVSPEDLSIDTILIRKRDATLNVSDWRQIFSRASDCEFYFGEKRVQVSCQEHAFIAKCWREGALYHLAIYVDPEIAKTFSGGVCQKKNGHLCLRSFPEFDPFEKSLINSDYCFGSREVPEISERLRALAQKIPLTDESGLDKKMISIAPHLAVKAEFNHASQLLNLHPHIVYGDPAIAEVVGGRLRLVGENIPIRDYTEESALLKQLQSLGLGTHIPTQMNIDQALPWLAQYRGLLKLASESLADLVIRSAALEPEFNFEDDTSFTLSFKAVDAKGHFKLSGRKVLDAWSSGSNYIVLDDFGYAAIPREWLAKYGLRLQHILKVTEEGKNIKSAPAIIPELMALGDEFKASLPPSWEAYRSFIEGIPNFPEYSENSHFNAVLRPYQKLGVARLKFHLDHELGLLLADDMGLGKTVQTAAILPQGALIIVPRSLLENWQNELKKLRPDLKVHLYHGGGRELLSDDEIILTTYGIIRRDLDLFLQRTWPLIVADEAREFKNAESQMATAVYQLKGKSKIALTGTPIENHLGELWSIMHFVAEGLLGSRDEFQQRYNSAGIHGQMAGASEVRRIIKPFILRRQKQDVLKELPEKIEKNIYFDLDADTQLSYNALISSRMPEVQSLLQGGSGYIEALQLILRLRQLCCHPGLVDPLMRGMHSEKVKLLINWLEHSKTAGHRALVFSQWTGFLDLIQPALDEAGFTYLRLDGSTQNRGEIVKSFQEQGKGDLLLLSLKAGGIGLNLTAADHVYILDPWWNPAIEDQAADRAHRIGQKNSVMVMRLIASHTIEEKILSLQETKRALYQEVLDLDDIRSRENASIANNRMEDVFTLLSGLL